MLNLEYGYIYDMQVEGAIWAEEGDSGKRDSNKIKE